MNNQINSELIENKYKDFFQGLRETLINEMENEIRRHISDRTVEEFFDDLNRNEALEEFVLLDKTKKIEAVLDWFKGELWTLEDAVYDLVRDSFDGTCPNIDIAYEKNNCTSRAGKFIYAIPIEKSSNEEV